MFRDDLSRILFDAANASVTYMLRDQVASLRQLDRQIDVRFEGGGRWSFDLLIGRTVSARGCGAARSDLRSDAFELKIRKMLFILTKAEVSAINLSRLVAESRSGGTPAGEDGNGFEIFRPQPETRVAPEPIFLFFSCVTH